MCIMFRLHSHMSLLYSVQCILPFQQRCTRDSRCRQLWSSIYNPGGFLVLCTKVSLPEKYQKSARLKYSNQCTETKVGKTRKHCFVKQKSTWKMENYKCEYRKTFFAVDYIGISLHHPLCETLCGKAPKTKQVILRRQSIPEGIYGDVSCHTEVQRLSGEKVLNRFEVREEICQVLWHCELAYLCNRTKHLTAPNLHL